MEPLDIATTPATLELSTTHEVPFSVAAAASSGLSCWHNVKEAVQFVFVSRTRSCRARRSNRSSQQGQTRRTRLVLLRR